MITSYPLFRYEPYPKHNLDEPTYMLYQMICQTVEDFDEEQLASSPGAAQFFDSTCKYESAGHPELCPKSQWVSMQVTSDSAHR